MDGSDVSLLLGRDSSDAKTAQVGNEAHRTGAEVLTSGGRYYVRINQLFFATNPQVAGPGQGNFKEFSASDIANSGLAQFTNLAEFLHQLGFVAAVLDPNQTTLTETPTSLGAPERSRSRTVSMARCCMSRPRVPRTR